MKHKSILHKLTAALLFCTLCCTGMTVPAFSVEETEELPAKFDLRDEGAMTSVKQQYGGGRNLRKDAYDNGTKMYGIAASLAAWQGVVYEDEVPSHSQKPELDESLRYRSIAHLQNAESYDTNDVLNAKHQLMKKGSLFLSYFNDHNHPLSDKSGYYNPNYTAGELDGNGHAVMIVGWDDNYPKESFSDSPPDDGA